MSDTVNFDYLSSEEEEQRNSPGKIVGTPEIVKLPLGRGHQAWQVTREYDEGLFIGATP